MELKDLPRGWTTTRGSLQTYAHVATAFARAAANPDPRWSHVAMDPSPTGFAASAVDLADGALLIVELDLETDRFVAVAGDDVVEFDLTEVPSPMDVGDAVLALTELHGSTIDVDHLGPSSKRYSTYTISSNVFRQKVNWRPRITSRILYLPV